MGQRVESLESDLFAALLALAEFLRRLEQAPQGLVHVPEVAPFLRGEQEGLLALHGVGALIRHVERVAREVAVGRDRKSTRLNSSHSQISYAVFCLKKKKLQYVRVSDNSPPLS